MTQSLLGMHWIRTHPDNRDFDHIAKMQYRSVKTFEWMHDNRDFCANLLAALPSNSYILARNHPRSEEKQDVWNDPVGTGVRHANAWAMDIASGKCHLPTDRTFFLPANELDATNGDRAAIDRYTTAFLDRLRVHGLRGGAFNFSTGHPRTVDGTGNTQADYTVFEGSHQAIVRGHHIAVQHIYGSSTQPCVPGHYDRLQACTWQDVEWVIGECGSDEHVTTGGAHDGYLRTMNPPDYCRWLDELIMGINDPRIHSYQVFTYDFSHPWDSFDIRPIRDALESYDWQHIKQAPPTVPNTPPVTVHLPSVGTGTEPSAPQGDNFGRAIEWLLRWEGGLSLNPEDHGNWTGGRKGQGELKGTNFGISAASYPNLDIRNLTREQAKEIYRRDYWQRSGANTLPWPASLLVFDTAVLHGVGTAQKWQQEVGVNPYDFAAKRLHTYTKLDNWNVFGAGWVNRTADLLEEMGK